jgi:hypothetical protein
MAEQDKTTKKKNTNKLLKTMLNKTIYKRCHYGVLGEEIALRDVKTRVGRT